jgi:rhodanese-related sulfurtransferase/glyoxylase-like metal-dependent hydrolase (beta-lactamase superfamily II)
MNPVGLKQFRVVVASRSDSGSDALLSYCIYDPESRDAILIDPHLDAIDEYVEFISSNRLKPILTLETQLHWSHPSASKNLKSRYSCPIGVSETSKAVFFDRKFRDQESIAVGSYRFQILLTPGASLDALVLWGEGLLVSGNTLWIGSCGPGGFFDSDACEHFKSLNRLVAWADSHHSILVLPAFDANDLIFSTLAREKEKNLALRLLASKEEFFRWNSARAVQPDESFKQIYDQNAHGGDLDCRFPRLESVFRMAGQFAEESDFNLSVGAINPAKYSLKLKEHAASNAFIDVREPDEYLAGHMAGTENIPWIEVGFHLTELRSKKRVYVSCLSGRRSTWASRTLAYLGFNNVVNVSGGFSAWQHAGLPVETENSLKKGKP